jgi:hypothetical protein
MTTATSTTMVVPQAITHLFTAMTETVPENIHPTGVIPIRSMKIIGTAFFPGGPGLYLDGRDLHAVDFPVGGAMILGHNFDSEAAFNRAAEQRDEALKYGTWGGLLRLLNAAAVPLEQCFFTNAFMGLCEGADNQKYSGREDAAFRAVCLAFLKMQIAAQRPRLIVTLGSYVPPLLASASPDLDAWRGRCKRGSCDARIRLKELDASPLIESARFEVGDGSVHRAVATAIAHPSLPNGRHRKPKGFSPGAAGEVECVRAGWDRTGIGS